LTPPYFAGVRTTRTPQGFDHEIATMPHSDDSAEKTFDDLLADLARAQRADLTGPIRVQSVVRTAGGTRSVATGAVLVPLDEPDARGVGIPLPVKMTAELTADGRLTSLQVDGASLEARRQAKAFGRSLIAGGAVRDATAAPARRGPGARATHEIQADERGRQVLVRSGFGASATPADGEDKK
jgi:hypothetical protein